MMTPDDIVNKQHKDQLKKINEITNNEAFIKNITLDDEIGYEIKELRSELKNY